MGSVSLKRLWLIAGFAVGFVIGSSMGRDPYEHLQSTVRSIGRRPEARKVSQTLLDAADEISDTAADNITRTKDKVEAALSPS